MSSIVPSDYAGRQVTASIASVLEVLTRHGFTTTESGRANKTINVLRNGTRCGYINETVMQKHGVVGYHFGAFGEDTNSCPPELKAKITSLFCTRYQCEPSDFVVHAGSGANRHYTYLIIKNMQVALRAMLQDAGLMLDPSTEIVKVEERYVEGLLVDVIMRNHERSSRARAACLSAYGFNCFACGVNLKSQYAGISTEVIHVHHELPLGEATGQREVNPITDMKPLCPNCHAVVHARTPPYSIKEVQQMLAK